MSPARVLLFPAVRVHIVIALDHAVVELALFVGAFAEIVLKFRFGRDDVFLPAVGILQVPSQGGVQPLGALLLQHPLTVGRIADDHAGLGG